MTLSLCTTSCKSVWFEKEIEIYAHGDIHGRFFGKDYINGEATASSLSHIYGYVKSRRDSIGKENILFLDLGDHNHGDNAAYYFNNVHKYEHNEDHLYPRIANFAGYDAAIVGNHDIEAGREALDKIARQSEFPYLAGNLSDSLGNLFEDYTIIEKGGLKIAVIGFTTPAAEKWIGSEKKRGINFTPIHKLAQNSVNKVIEKEKPDLTILAIHAGTGNGDSTNHENPGLYLAKSIKGADIILTAHDHKSYNNNVKSKDSVLVINSGEWGKKLARINIGVTRKFGKITALKYKPELVDCTVLSPDSSFDNHFENEYYAVKEFSNKNLGISDRDIAPGKILEGSCTYSNLLHYVQLKKSGADISFVSPTKFRGTIPAGNINYNTVLQMYPFENILYTVSLTGKQIKHYLELCCSDYDENGKYKGNPARFDCAGGLNYTVDCTKPVGERIQIHSLQNGKTFSENKRYSIAMVSYRANGGGDILTQATGYPVKKLEELVLCKHGDVRELIYQFFLSGKKVSEIENFSTWKLISSCSVQ